MNNSPKKAKLSGMKPSHRRSIISSQLQDLVHYERVQTTPRKVKLLKQGFDRLVNDAKKNTEASKRSVAAALGNPKAVAKLYTQILPRLQDSNSGYTLSALTLPRRGDGAAQAIIMVKGAELRERKSRLAQALEKREEKETKKPAGIRSRLGAPKAATEVKPGGDARKKDATKDTRRISK
jgi:large subunit ribosomal protein L17